MQPVETVAVADEAALREAFEVRRRVFVDEQRVPEALEFDAFDAAATHLLARAAGRPVGTLRLRPLGGGTIKIERVAVLIEARGSGVGRRLVQAALDLARGAGAVEARLHAQVRARPFYERLGFEACGPSFIEDGIPHVLMRRRLRPDEASAA